MWWMRACPIYVNRIRMSLNASIDRDMQLNEVCALIPYVIMQKLSIFRCILYSILSSKSLYIFPMMALVCVSSTSVSPQLLQLCCMGDLWEAGPKGHSDGDRTLVWLKHVQPRTEWIKKRIERPGEFTEESV